jgi:hypothetical protein
MQKFMRVNGWLGGLLIFSMPILLFFFLGTQMAYSQVNSRFEVYQTIPEITRLADLADLPAGQIVMLRGQIAESNPVGHPSGLLIFQERPTNGREVRFREEFNLIFPPFTMQLPDGVVTISPSQNYDRIIQHEIHSVADGDLTRTGFKPGDTVTIQGQWQPTAATLAEVTGITGADKAGLMAEWQDAFQKVAWARNILGFFTLLGIILLVSQIRRSRASHPTEEDESAWTTPTTETAPTA